MLFALLFVAQSQSLPDALREVTLRITKIENAGRTVYVVTSDRFDPEKPARVQVQPHRRKALKGEHMTKISSLVSLDTQRVFVLPEAPTPFKAAREALVDAGVKYVATN